MNYSVVNNANNPNDFGLAVGANLSDVDKLRFLADFYTPRSLTRGLQRHGSTQQLSASTGGWQQNLLPSYSRFASNICKSTNFDCYT